MEKTILLNAKDNNQFTYVTNNTVTSILFLIVSSLLVGFVLFLISPLINNAISKFVDYVEKNLLKRPAKEIIFGSIGAIVGLIISSLIVGIFAAHSTIGAIFAIMWM